MENERKTKKQLIEELHELHQSVAEVENLKEEIKQTRLNQEKFTKAFLQNSIPLAITTVKDGRFVDVSDAFLRLVELKREEVIGHTSRETGFITEEQRTLFYNELGKNGRVENFEMEVRLKGRGVRYGLFNIIMLSFNNENYLLTAIQDTTDRKQAELQLKELELKFHTIADFTRDWENWIGINGKPIWISPSVERISGYSISECMAMPDYPFPMIYPEDRGKFLAEIHKANEQPLNDIELRIIRKDGTLGWLSVSTNPVFIEAGSSAGHRSSIRDITNRKRIEEALRESEENYHLLFNNSFDAIAVLGGTPPHVLFVNDAFHRLFGYTSEEILRFSAGDMLLLVHPDDREMVKNNLNSRQRKESVPSQYEFRIITKNGGVCWVEVSASLFSKGDQIFSQAIYRDITDRKQAEDKLIKYHTELEALIKERTGDLENKVKTLENLNTTLDFLLQKREQDKKIMEENFILNIKKLVIPYVKMVGKGTLNKQQRLCLTAIEKHLDEIISPLLKSLHQFDLTPREQQISVLLKNGMTTKEIVEILGVAKGTIDTHRKSIRKKIGLSRKLNLQTNLQSLKQ
jgi:PAS domain S-box-containing protein